MPHTTTNDPVSAAPQDFASLLTSLSVSDGKPPTKPAQGPPRPSKFASPSSMLVPEKLPTYTESESTRGTKRKAELPAPKPTPDPNNPFFDSRLDLKHAAGLVYRILKAAHTSSNHWADVMSESHFHRFAEKAKHQPEHALNRIIKDITHTLELLRFGRKGWYLTDLPYNFFEDIEQLLPDIVMKMNKISEYRGCASLLRKLVLPLVEVEKRFKGVHKERARIEKDFLAKQAQFWNEDAKKLIEEGPKMAMERVFGFKAKREEVRTEVAMERVFGFKAKREEVRTEVAKEEEVAMERVFGFRAKRAEEVKEEVVTEEVAKEEELKEDVKKEVAKEEEEVKEEANEKDEETEMEIAKA